MSIELAVAVVASSVTGVAIVRAVVSGFRSGDAVRPASDDNRKDRPKGVPARGQCWLNLRAITSDGQAQHVGCRRVEEVELDGIKNITLIARFPVAYDGTAQYFVGPSDREHEPPVILSPVGRLKTVCGDIVLVKLELHVTHVNEG